MFLRVCVERECASRLLDAELGGRRAGDLEGGERGVEEDREAESRELSFQLEVASLEVEVPVKVCERSLVSFVGLEESREVVTYIAAP